MWITLSIYLLVTRVVIASSFLALNILVNNSVERNLIGKANGLAMSLSSAGRLNIVLYIILFFFTGGSEAACELFL